MNEFFIQLMPMILILITYGILEYICYRIAVYQLDMREILGYFDRTTWLVLILVTNIIGLLIFFVMESQPPRI